MKLIIEIPEEKLNIIKNKMYCGIYDPDLYKAIADATPLDDVKAEIERLKHQYTDVSGYRWWNNAIDNCLNIIRDRK